MVQPLIELVVMVPTFCYTIYLVIYYLLMGYSFVKILEVEFEVSKQMYWFYFGSMTGIILLTWANTV